MRVLELFSGTHSVGVICKEKGHEVISLDRDLNEFSKLYDYKSDFHIKEDIMNWNYKQFESGFFDLITMSPVCLWWSCMRRAVLSKEKCDKDIKDFGEPMVDKCIEILNYLKPKYYWIENPYTGRMKEYIKKKYPDIYSKNYIVDYCQYDKNIGYQKRTIFWTNIPNFKPKKCNGKGKCPNMNGSRHKINIAYNTYIIDNGKKVFIFTKELRAKYKNYEKHHQKSTKSKYDRYKIPFDLIRELINNCN